MLVSYAVLIFVLMSSVVAPPPPAPQQEGASGSQQRWQVLKGNTDTRLLKPLYKLKFMTNDDYPTWPKDQDLDRAIQFIPAKDANGGVEQVSILRLYREIFKRQCSSV
ncbi:hypothetical protein AX14_000332 [Amanita brunnescens Koide BX004]|nr:hypothetical protein AX14_000332 [Amanita brunnescens Koide BX004]